MRYFARFTVEGGFHGELSPIRTHEDLFNRVYDRVKFLEILDDENGVEKDPSEFTEVRLLEIFKSVSMHQYIELLSSFDDVRALSDHSRYQKLCDEFAELHQIVTSTVDPMADKVIIHEMEGEEELYSLHFEGSAEDFGFSDKSDELTAADAHEIAVEVADATGADIVWEGTKPSWV